MIHTNNLLVFDTHAWFWLATGDPELIRNFKIKEFFEKHTDMVNCISAITPWEIAMLEVKQRIVLKSDCLSWLKESIDKTCVRIIPLTTEISVEATHLPGNFHGDPADRIITATARHIGGTLLTRDKSILEYGAKGFVSVLKV